MNQKMSNFDPPFFGHFYVRQKCPFCPLRAEVLKHKIKNTKKWTCDHYALKTVFFMKKLLTENFWGLVNRPSLEI